MITFCSCEHPELNENKTACILCGLPIEPPPPSLGVSVKESVNAGDKVGE
jgi:hypothetical protein